ncbi:MAG: lipoprotein signal peptidase [Lentimicrobiaceae bacterium]|jgi:signal peptidase II|nr:lipoprotein signal peptidase [Lentimicrobiaceae bacterium]
MKKPLLVVLVVVLLDQLLKFWIKLNMTLGEEINVFGNWFKLHFIENNGMAFGIEFFGEWGKLGLSIFRILAVILLTYYLYRLSRRKVKLMPRICIALFIAGALGNILDSAFYGLIFSESTTKNIATLFPEGGGYAPFLFGKVVDMFYFPIIDIERANAAWLPNFFFGSDGHFIFFRPIFNVADAAITTSVFWLALFERKFLRNM